MVGVVRLLTIVDLDQAQGPVAAGDVPSASRVSAGDARPGVAPSTEQAAPVGADTISLSALHLAVLDDGRRLTLLDDRGWGESGPADIWKLTSVAEIESTARMVVGPDDDDARTVTAHWAHLATVLGTHGVHVDAGQLQLLPHDIELTAQVRARLAG